MEVNTKHQINQNYFHSFFKDNFFSLSIINNTYKERHGKTIGVFLW